MESIQNSNVHNYDDAKESGNRNDHEFSQLLGENSTGSGSIKINNTTIVFKPNTGKIDLKLFVGQIPKDWDESQITSFFSKYGEILESQIIREGSTGTSKGCAFVKFASMTKAEEAIKELTSKDNPVYLPGVSNPILLRWADGEEQRLGLLNIDQKQATKLFVGSLPPQATEDNLRDVFQAYGNVEDVNIMRRPDGSSKGCAFIKFQMLESALLAIRSLNAQAYILGSDQPIEVRFAENKKKPSSGPTQSTPTHQTHRPYGGPHPGSMSGHPSYPPWNMPQRPPSVTYIRYHTPEGTPYFYNTVTQATQWEEPPGGSLVYVEEWGNAPYYIPAVDKPPTMDYGQTQQAVVKKPGPAGSNLFIFHLPNEWRDQDLYFHFRNFGNILSHRIMTDNKTGRSKGFGFVSYDNPMSAKAAIDHMNGFQVGAKRLKVTIKKGDDEETGGAMTSGYKPF